MSDSTIRIKLLNNQGAGFAEMHTVSAGTSVGDFFTDKVGGDSERYKITMNGEPVTFQDPIAAAEGLDFARIVITPMKIEGA
tara:strand:- start:868 stop:1113 length:246 start_codon:yes stop_codon:yes gene_type:complete